MEEAGVDVVLKGILSIDHFMQHRNGVNTVKKRVIYYAEPTNPNCVPKQVADSESEEARWVTLEEFT